MTDEAMVEAVARAICAETYGRCTCAEGYADYRVHCDDAERSARAAIRAVSPLIIERCAKAAGETRVLDDEDGGTHASGAFNAQRRIVVAIRALNHFGDATEMVRALIQKEPSCAPAGVTSPPR